MDISSTPGVHPGWPTTGDTREATFPQSVPVKMFRAEDLLTVAAPMPGLSEEYLDVEVTGDGQLVLRGALRGVIGLDKELLVDEWSVGPYHRVLPLPVPVDGSCARVTYGNGVVVVAMPVATVTTGAHLTPMSPIFRPRPRSVQSAARSIPTTP